MAYFAKGTALAGLRKDEEAIAAMDKSIRLDPTSPATTEKDLLSQKTRATNTLVDRIFTDPLLENKNDNYAALVRDGIRLDMAGEAEKTIATLNKAIALQPENPAAYYVLGWVNYETQKWSLSLECMTKAQKLAGGKTFTLPGIGTGQTVAGNIEPCEIFYFQGCAHYYQKNNNSALQCLSKAISLSRRGKYFKARADVYAALGQDGQARVDTQLANKLTQVPAAQRNFREPLESILQP
jgi:tetratricopeptide (TPR) repeat protein